MERDYAAVQQSGSITAAAVTATTAATANAILTLSGLALQLRITTTFATECMVTRNGVDFQWIPAGTGGYVIDPRRSYFASGDIFGAYRTSGTVTSGAMYIQTT